MVLVPKTVYVAVYTDDGEEPTGPLTPISSISPTVQMPVGPAVDQQPAVTVDYARMLKNFPLPESYAMYGPGSAASFPYGAVGPQLQYAAVPEAVPAYDTMVRCFFF